MRWMMRTFLLGLTFFMCTISSARGLDFAVTTRIGATASDNINRNASGFEESGSILTQGVGIQASSEKERRSFLLSLEGGWETLESKTVSSSEGVYRIDLNFNLPLSRTGWLEGTAGASRETATPDLDDPDQTRTLVERSEVGLLVGRDASRVSRWEAGMNASKEDQVDREIRDITGRILWSRDLSPVRTFSVEGSGTDGTDDFNGTSWLRMSADLTLAERLSPTLSRTFRLNWEDVDFEGEDGDRDTSWRVGLSGAYESRRSHGWSHQGSVGFSRLTQSSGENSWEPTGSFSVEKDLSRTTVADLGIEIQTVMRDPRESDIELTRRERFTGGLTWNVSRWISVLPRVDYLFDDVTGREVADREDETVSVRVDARWTPSSTWRMELGIVAEDRESTDPNNELTEKRVELRASTLFQ